VLKFLRRAERHARRIAGLCTGGFVLAEAGLLDERRATTHWAHARVMQQRHPAIRVEEDRIFIHDGPVWTSAGMSAALDLALAMVEADLGEEIARKVAHQLVMPQRRAGGQSQHSELLELAPKSDRIQQALDYARAHLKQALSVEELAEVAHLSPRQFSRVFTAETGLSPAKAVEGLRLESARLMIEQSRHPLEIVARESGFRDRRHLREVFVRKFGVPPQATPVHAFSLIGGRKSLAGSLIGGIAETQEMLDFCAQKRIVADVEVIPAAKINEAYERMLKNDVRYRFSIDCSTF